MKQHLDYSLDFVDTAMMVSLSGELGPGSAPTLDCCLDRVSAFDFDAVVLNCGELSMVHPHALKPFAKFIAELRTRGGALQICFLDPMVGKLLLKNRVIAEVEWQDECPEDTGLIRVKQAA